MYRFSIIVYSLVFFAFLIISACAPEPIFRLEPEVQETTFYQGMEYVHFQDEGLFISMGYYRHMDDQFIMDVEIINERDSTLFIDPTQFSSSAYGRTDRGAANDSMLLTTEYSATDPENELLEIDKQISKNRAAEKTDRTFFLIGQGLSVASEVASDSPEEKEEIREDRAISYLKQEQDERRYQINRANLGDLREAWEQDALRKTHLLPGEGIRGLVFFKTIDKARTYTIRFQGAGTYLESSYYQYKYKP